MATAGMRSVTESARLLASVSCTAMALAGAVTGQTIVYELGDGADGSSTSVALANYVKARSSRRAAHVAGATTRRGCVGFVWLYRKRRAAASDSIA